MNINFFNYLNFCLNENKLAHAFLIESNNIDITTSKIIAYLYSKKIIKHIDFEKNLNLLVIEPEGKEIKIKDIMMIKNIYSTIPINDKFNIYIIKSAEKLNISSANKILKFLEEPEKFVIGFLITETANNVISTIRSRCQIFKLTAEENGITNLEEDINYFLELFYVNNFEQEIYIKKNYAKKDRGILIDILEQVLNRCEKILNEKDEIIEAKELSRKVMILDNILRMLKSNVNIELVLDKLFIELRN